MNVTSAMPNLNPSAVWLCTCEATESPGRMYAVNVARHLLQAIFYGGIWCHIGTSVRNHTHVVTCGVCDDVFSSLPRV